MVQFADNKTAQNVREMWKICFGDSDAFIDLYFDQKYKNENTLIYLENDKVVASVQMLPYEMRFYGSIIPFSYISGACTLPEFRGKGYMKELLIASFKIMQQRNIPLSILIPAEEWLYGFYAKYGYEQTFDDGIDELDIKSLLHHYPDNIPKAYAIFDANFQQNDFMILKTESDFNTIIQDCMMDNCTARHNLRGMSRIIDATSLLNFYAKRNPNKNFSIKVSDELISSNNGTFIIQDGIAFCSHHQETDIDVNIQFLARLLFGYHTNDLIEEYNSLFEQHQPVMNLMLE